jgi:hypothetical protein
MLAEAANIIRARTIKRNIRYSVMRVKDRGAVKEEVIRVMSRLKASITRDQKEVMYCRSKQGYKGLTRKLKCDFYHAKMKRGDETRREKFRR